MASKWLTAAEAKARFGAANVERYADRDGDGTEDTGVVDAALERAEAMVEAKLLTRFAPALLPTTTVTASLLLKEIVGGFFIWCVTDHADLRGEAILKALELAERRLADVCKGTASLLLVGNPAADLTAPQLLTAALTDSQRAATVDDGSRGTFTRESMVDW